MYAVIKSGGKQYKVEVGDKVKLEALPVEAGETIEFDQVLAVGGDSGLQIGTPTLAATVTGKVLQNAKDKKVRVVKFKRRKNYIRNHGHRQMFTEVELTNIAG